jgi:hypothetical protein
MMDDQNAEGSLLGWHDCPGHEGWEHGILAVRHPAGGRDELLDDTLWQVGCHNTSEFSEDVESHVVAVERDVLPAMSGGRFTIPWKTNWFLLVHLRGVPWAYVIGEPSIHDTLGAGDLVRWTGLAIQAGGQHEVDEVPLRYWHAASDERTLRVHHLPPDRFSERGRLDAIAESTFDNYFGDPTWSVSDRRHETTRGGIRVCTPDPDVEAPIGTCGDELVIRGPMRTGPNRFGLTSGNDRFKAGSGMFVVHHDPSRDCWEDLDEGEELAIEQIPESHLLDRLDDAARELHLLVHPALHRRNFEVRDGILTLPGLAELQRTTSAIAHVDLICTASAEEMPAGVDVSSGRG